MDKFAEILKSKLSPGAYLLAVSGGADSMALLEAASILHGVDKNYRFEVAHVNHNLRKSSIEDTEFVNKEAKKRDFFFNFIELSNPPKSNIEDWARKERYKNFKDICEAKKLIATLTAHTANDIVETYLMKIVANKEPRLITEFDQKRKVFRPFLEVRREQIKSFLKAHTVAHIEDESNEDTRFLRNRVRNKLIPFLRENFDGDPIEILLNRALGIQDDCSYIDDSVTKVILKIEAEFGSKTWMQSVQEVLESQPLALQWRIVEEFLQPVVGFRIGRVWGHRVVQFFLSQQAGIELPGGITLRRKNGGISVDPSAKT